MIFENNSLHFSFEVEDARVSVIAMGTPVSQGLGAEKRFHAHDGYEMHAVKEGTATVSTDAGELSLSSGDLLIIPPKHLHYGVAAKEDATVASLCFFFEKSAESEK